MAGSDRAVPDNLVAVIMAGGVGTRFWPLSTRERPKQFIRLFDDRSLLQKSYDRVAGLVPDDRIMVLTNRRFAGLVAEQLPGLPPDNIIGEPVRRDTAAAVTLAALLAQKRFHNPVIATLTADHLIEPVGVFQRALLSAARAAADTGALYTFGIRPEYPATGYGYLSVGDRLPAGDSVEHFRLEAFKEKPDQGTARQYLESGRHLWNSGMFVWTAGAVLSELERHLPEHVRSLSRAVDAWGAPQWKATLDREFTGLERISIDYAVMEKARDVRCVAGEFSWKDVGGWLAVQEGLEVDDHGNRTRGRVYTLDAGDNLVFCDQPGETLALLGLSDVVVVRAGDKTLVARKDRLEDVKRIVEAMMKDDRTA